MFMQKHRWIPIVIVVAILFFNAALCTCPPNSVWHGVYTKGDRTLSKSGSGCACPGKLGWTLQSCILSDSVPENWVKEVEKWLSGD